MKFRVSEVVRKNEVLNGKLAAGSSVQVVAAYENKVEQEKKRQQETDDRNAADFATAITSGDLNLILKHPSKLAFALYSRPELIVGLYKCVIAKAQVNNLANWFLFGICTTLSSFC